jgi:hypothetical protein
MKVIPQRFFDKWLKKEKWLVFSESGSKIWKVDRIFRKWLEFISYTVAEGPVGCHIGDFY